MHSFECVDRFEGFGEGQKWRTRAKELTDGTEPYPIWQRWLPISTLSRNFYSRKLSSSTKRPLPKLPSPPNKPEPLRFTSHSLILLHLQLLFWLQFLVYLIIMQSGFRFLYANWCFLVEIFLCRRFDRLVFSFYCNFNCLYVNQSCTWLS